MTEMRHRVQCRRCNAHRDLTKAPRCFVCGAEAYDDVKPTAGDRAEAVDKAVAEVLAAAEQVDRALYAGAEIANGHRCALRLSEACRQLALARAGVTS